MKKLFIIISIVLVITFAIIAMSSIANRTKAEIYENLPGACFHNHSESHMERTLENPFYWFDKLDDEIDTKIYILDDSTLKITKTGWSKVIEAETKRRIEETFNDEKIYTYQVNVSLFGKATITIIDTERGKQSKHILTLSPSNTALSIDGSGLYVSCEFYPSTGGTFNRIG